MSAAPLFVIAEPATGRPPGFLRAVVRRISPRTLAIAALVLAALDERLYIDVTTSTAAFDSGVAAAPRLEQIGERLRALYGDEARFDWRRSDTGAGSHASLDLPLERGGDRDQGGAT